MAVLARQRAVYFLYCLFILLSLFFIQCEYDLYSGPSEPIIVEILYGRYAANFGDGCIYYFDLHPDSVLVYYFEKYGERKFVDTCRWYVEKESPGNYKFSIFGCSKNFEDECGVIKAGTFFCRDDTNRYIISKKFFRFWIAYDKKKGMYFEKMPGMFKECNDTRR
jgi:hypothetical protein